VELETDDDVWEVFGVPPAEVARWKALNFEPFEAALAHGDGFTPTAAVHYSRQLRKTADSWRRTGLNSVEGLHWHRAGFGPKEAIRWRSDRVDVETARRRRDGYDRTSDIARR
jgi:hypothetical protein